MSFWTTEMLQTPGYKTGDYARRNWGSTWHSLCSYHGKLKPAIAHMLVKEFSEPGDLVLDPLAGVGTIPLEARILGRRAIGNDLSSLAATVTRAKLISTDDLRLDDFLADIDAKVQAVLKRSDPLETFVDFGLNGKISAYFHPDTLREILVLRELMDQEFRGSTEGALIFSCFAHVLHGNRPYALSRRSHPLTPYAPSGPFEYKHAIEHISAKVRRALAGADATTAIQGRSYEGDYGALANETWFGSVDLIATSPPFVGSMRFHSQNWMRLWLAGWEENDFKRAHSALETPGDGVLGAYKEFVEFCYGALRPGGLAVLHTGKNKACDMGAMIVGLQSSFERVSVAVESVSGGERHGIRDKGGTSEHQFVFMQKQV